MLGLELIPDWIWGALFALIVVAVVYVLGRRFPQSPPPPPSDVEEERDKWLLEAQEANQRALAAESRAWQAEHERDVERAARIRAERSVADGAALFTSIEDMYAENRRLRRRVQELEVQLGSVGNIQR